MKEIGKKATKVTHNHPEGMKGAEAVACAIYLARKHSNSANEIEIIKKYICENYYDISFTLDEIRPTYKFNETCQHTVPEALEAFFESTSFEDAIRNAISIGGDSDTVAAITGSVAGAYYGVPEEIYERAKGFFDKRISGLVNNYVGNVSCKQWDL